MRRAWIFLTLAVILVRCTSPGEESVPDILEPVEETAAETPAPVAEGEPALPAELPPEKPHDKLMSLLSSLGYQGIGLEHEDPAVLDRLHQVFSSPEAQGLEIKLVYTGMRMEYDPKEASLTIGGLRDVKAILKFLQKRVPRRDNSGTEAGQP